MATDADVSSEEIAAARVAAVLDEAGHRALAGMTAELSHVDHLPAWEAELIQRYDSELEQLQRDHEVTDREVAEHHGAPGRREDHGLTVSLGTELGAARAAERLVEIEVEL